MQGQQRIDVTLMLSKVSDYLMGIRYPISISKDAPQGVVKIVGVVPSYYTRQIIQKSIMQLLLPGFHLDDTEISVNDSRMTLC